MTDKRWKARERQTARLLGTERLPLWLLRAVDQAARNALAGTHPAVVLVAQPAPGWPLRRIVVLDFSVFAELVHDGDEVGA